MATENNKTDHREIVAEVDNLVVHYEMDDYVVEAVNNVSLQIARGETLGIVGETGAGKTTIALAMMGLLPQPPSNVLSGSVRLHGEDLFTKSKREMRKIRGRHISMIFQDPMSALNPVHKVGEQVAEVISLHRKVSKKEAQAQAIDMLKMVGIQPERYEDYPHQFSGGMKQRVVIAIALTCRPDLIIADEPTTALDVTIQAQVLDLMRRLRDETNTAMLLITHDFGVVADICDRCAVLYAGEIVESGSVEQIFENPLHPYTTGLFGSLPSLEQEVEKLRPIPGLMIDPAALPEYCSFYDRCEKRTEACKQQDPKLLEVEDGHCVKCLLCEGIKEG